MTTTIDLLSRVVYVERLVVERLVCCFYIGFLPLSRTRLRERFRDEEEKQQKAFNIKVPDPLSPGVSPGSFMSNEFAMMCSFICVLIHLWIVHSRSQANLQ